MTILIETSKLKSSEVLISSLKHLKMLLLSTRTMPLHLEEVNVLLVGPNSSSTKGKTTATRRSIWKNSWGELAQSWKPVLKRTSVSISSRTVLKLRNVMQSN